MNFHNIEPNNIENGTGIRTLLWVSGCYHNCPGCHNPVTHDPDDGVLFDDDAMKELMDDLNRDFIEGITFTGGDPLTFYPEETLDIINKIQERFEDRKTIWIYTGFTLDWLLKISTESTDHLVKETYAKILLNTDVLCDGRFIESESSKEYHWVGSTNQRVINMKESLKQHRVVFLEEDQRQFCTTDCTETDALIKAFVNTYKVN